MCKNSNVWKSLKREKYMLLFFLFFICFHDNSAHNIDHSQSNQTCQSHPTLRLFTMHVWLNHSWMQMHVWFILWVHITWHHLKGLRNIPQPIIWNIFYVNYPTKWENFALVILSQLENVVIYDLANSWKDNDGLEGIIDLMVQNG